MEDIFEKVTLNIKHDH